MRKLLANGHAREPPLGRRTLGDKRSALDQARRLFAIKAAGGIELGARERRTRSGIPQSPKTSPSRLPDANDEAFHAWHMGSSCTWRKMVAHLARLAGGIVGTRRRGRVGCRVFWAKIRDCAVLLDFAGAARLEPGDLAELVDRCRACQARPEPKRNRAGTGCLRSGRATSSASRSMSFRHVPRRPASSQVNVPAKSQGARQLGPGKGPSPASPPRLKREGHGAGR